MELRSNLHSVDLRAFARLPEYLHDIVDMALSVDAPGIARRTKSIRRRANIRVPISTERMPPSR